MITASQIKAARSVCGLSVRELSEATGVGAMTIKRYEAAISVPISRKDNLARLRAFFEARGIEFIGAPGQGPGIRLWGDSQDTGS